MPKRYLNPSSLFNAATYGFSQIVLSESTGRAYLSGQTALDVDGNLSGGRDFAAQLQGALGNLDRALAAIGASRKDVVRVRLYLVDHTLDHLELVGQTMATFFGPDALPASTLLGVARLAMPDLLVEIEAECELASEKLGPI